ncbi:uncharacterized protein LOC104861397 [Fukomys damarensis]|uniref:uncharacterized protein LOC104861397 n=1 Tax=Fukomys damarensis TaxID=885580 RepID=UPI00053FA47E|nr:uncharacterized protein LOC104861397 [Fukomys damarensis]XP_033617823.1 uncharacterized protein LOC104861397 [Fukomys damarensis]XP_033617824.1 uncharacterized protein LOC104861397 [Fukomys damarensis]
MPLACNWVEPSVRCDKPRASGVLLGDNHWCGTAAWRPWTEPPRTMSQDDLLLPEVVSQPHKGLRMPVDRGWPPQTESCQGFSFLDVMLCPVALGPPYLFLLSTQPPPTPPPQMCSCCKCSQVAKDRDLSPGLDSLGWPSARDALTPRLFTGFTPVGFLAVQLTPDHTERPRGLGEPARWARAWEAQGHDSCTRPPACRANSWAASVPGLFSPASASTCVPGGPSRLQGPYSMGPGWRGPHPHPQGWQWGQLPAKSAPGSTAAAPHAPEPPRQ